MVVNAAAEDLAVDLDGGVDHDRLSLPGGALLQHTGDRSGANGVQHHLVVADSEDGVLVKARGPECSRRESGVSHT